MSKIQIRKGDYSPISAHFNASELFCKSADAPAVHPFYSELVDALEFLRSHYGTPWRATSTFRTESEERAILAKLETPFFVDVHMRGEAVDSQPVTGGPAIMADLAHQFLTGGPVFQELRRLDINGFGLYDTFIHLDVRKEKVPHRDAFGLLAHWDSRRDNSGSPWGPAFPSQKKSAGDFPSPKLTPTFNPFRANHYLTPVAVTPSHSL